MAVRAGSLSHPRIVALLRKYFVCAHLPLLTTADLIPDPADVELLRGYDAQTKGMLTAGEREVFFTPDGRLVDLFLSLNEGKKQYALANRADPADALRRFFEGAARAWTATRGPLPGDWEALRDGSAPEVERVRRMPLPAPAPERDLLSLRVALRHDAIMYEELAGWERVSFSREEARALAAPGAWPAASFRRLARAFIPRGGGVDIRLEDGSVRGSLSTAVAASTGSEIRGTFEGRFELAPSRDAERGRRENFRPWVESKGDLAGDFAFDPRAGEFTSFRLAARDATHRFTHTRYGDQGVHALHVGVELIRLPALDALPPVADDDRLVVELVAREPEILTPTGIAVDSRGRIWAVENNSHFRPKDYKGPPTDRILVLEDFGPDGRARKVTTFAEGFQNGMALALGKGGEVYFATRSEVLLLREGGGRTTLARLETAGTYPHNGLSGFAFDAEGRLYFALGENLGAPYRLVGADGTTLSGGGEGGNIYRCRTDGTGLVRVATGFWNTFHMAFDAFGRLFAVDNDPDSRPPNRLLHIVPGGDYGYRFRNGRKGLHPFTAWNGELPGTLPMVAGTGEGASGIVAYESAGLPADYQGALLVTSWGDHVIQRFRPEPRGASFAARAETVVKGDENFRPVGIAIAPDGSVVISDWVDKSYPLHGKGRIWRIRAKAPAPAPPSGLRDRFRALGPGAGLDDPAEEVRGEAARRLAPDDARRPAMAASDPSKFVRMQAILGMEKAPPSLVPLLADPDPFLAGAVLDALGRCDAASIREHAAAADPRVRVGVLLALRRRGDASIIPRFLEDPDPGVRRAAIQWAGEDGLLELAPLLEKGALRPPATLETFEAFLAAHDFLDAKARVQLDEKGGESRLAKVLWDAAQPPEVRAFALRMLRPDHPSVSAAPLRDLLRAGHAALRLEAARSLAALPGEAAQESLRALAADPEADLALRAEAALGLARSASSSAETRRVLLPLLDFPALRQEAARSLGREAAGAPADWRKVAAKTGDAAAGGRVFFHPRGPQCFACHKVNGRGGALGPDLSAIGRQLDRAKLVDALLDPGKEAAPAFAGWEIVSTGGDSWIGRIVEETPEAVTLLVGLGTRVTVRSGEIRERRALRSSLMPEGLHLGLTAREFRDLLAFLEGLR